MPEIRSIEEYVRGPDGDESKGLRPTLEEVIDEAKAIELERIQVECRSTPMGSTGSRQDWTTTFTPTDPQESVLEALRRKLESSPADHFSGTIRLNFRAYGSSSTHLGSHTRKMRPAISGSVPATDGAGLALPGDLAQTAAYFTNLVKPMGDQMIRQLDVAARVLDASAKVVAATHPPASGGGNGGGGMVGDLLRGAFMIAQDNSRTEAGMRNGAGAPVGPSPVSGYGLAPPGPPGFARPRVGPPGPGGPPGGFGQAQPAPPPSTPATPAQPKALPAPREITEEDVREWAQRNQGRATSLVMQLVDDRGMQIVPKGS